MKDGRRDTRLYLFLLRAYPRRFRERYRKLMAEAFVSDLRRARGLSVLHVWIHTIFDFFGTLGQEWSRSFQEWWNDRKQKENPPVEANGMMRGVFQDVRLGIRALGRNPGFTAVAALLLALGIGANTTIFTVVNGCFFAPPPGVTEPDRLVRLNLTTPEGSAQWWSHPDYAFYREHNEAFSDLCAYEPDGMVVTARTGDRNVSIRAWYVSQNYFDVLGIRPEIGRTFAPEEGRSAGTHAVAVMSYGLWHRLFGGDPEAIGASLRLNGHPFTIVGVVPEHFHGTSPVEPAPDLWIPTMMQPVLTPTGPDWLERVEDERIDWLQVLGRLPPDVSLEAAQANMDAISTSLLEEFPPPLWSQEGQGVALSPHYQYEPGVRDSLVSLARILMVVVGLVLLIACANVAILLLARASARRAELGIQVALGARRGRIVRQLLVESLLLTLLGGVGGYLVAFWSSDLVARTFPFSFGIAFEPDATVLAFTMIVAAGAALLFGTVPALLASRSDVASLIKTRDSGATRSPLRRALVIAQVALSTVLVIGSVQFVRSLRSAEAVELGFETERRLLVSLNLASHGYETSDMGPFIENVLDRLEALPGVVRASTTLHTPFRGQWTGSFVPEGADSEEESERASFNAVGPDYFRTMGIPVITGRDFTKADDAEVARVILMSEAAARKYWPDGDWIGKTISGAGSEAKTTVIGVVRDANYHELGEAPVPRIYLSALQPFMSFMGRVNFLVQTAGDPLSVSGMVQSEIHKVDPDVAITSVTTMKDCVERVLGRYRVGATVVGLFGTLALALAAIGLYGVLSFLVVRRTRAIGIQMALGATQIRIARSVVGEGFKLALVGIALGIPLALVSVDFIESFLYGIEPKDPATFSVVPLVLAAVACLAAFLPARRASRVNPIDALREE